MNTALVLTAAALGIGSAAHATVVADSVADFSGVQGANGWQYGYIVPSDGNGFRLMPQFGMHPGLPAPGYEPAWYIEFYEEPILFPTRGITRSCG